MRQSLLAAALVLPFGATAADTRLTVYSGDYDAVVQSVPAPGMPGFALVRQVVTLTPDADGRIAIAHLPAALDAAGVQLAPRDPGTRVTGQRFEFAAGAPADLLQRAVGERVGVTYAVGSESKSVAGTLVSAGEGLVLQLDGGGVLVLSDYAGFTLETLPSGVHAGPWLQWTVSGARGAQEYVLDYPTGGFGWRAEYVATLDPSTADCTLSLSGDAYVVNRSGAGFENVELRLVAGAPNRQPVAAPPMQKFRGEMAMVADAGLPAQAAGEYHAYTVPGRVDVPDNGVQRVPLLGAARRVGCESRYETRPALAQFVPGAPIVDPGFVPEGELPVVSTVRFGNTKANGLGVPLPAGRVRFFAADSFQGEGAIGHTPEDRSVEVEVGTAFDLTATRTRKDLQLAEDRLALSERIQVVVRNAKDRPATVQVRESMPRWTAWEITESTHESEKDDAQTARFAVKVPAKGAATLEYVVRYRWPDSVKP